MILSIVVSNSEKKRSEERSLYARRCKELKQTSKRLQDFEDFDKPEFRLWLESELGALMDVCQHAASELSELSHLIQVVKEYANFEGISQRAAYIYVKAARESGSELSYRDEDDDEDGETPKGCGTHDEEFSDQDSRKQQKGDTRAEAGGKAPQEYLKNVYRQLVRLLHPDTNSKVSQEKADLWHEVQNAHGWGDIQRLELILKKLTGDDSKSLDLKVIPISHLMDLRRDVENRLRTFKNRIAAARLELAWDFRTLKKNKKHLATMKCDLKYDLDSELREIKSKISGFRRQISNWEKPRPEKNKKSYRTNMNHPTSARTCYRDTSK